ncbi:MAG TPA: hypothetical protein VNO26_00040 [Candidatus Limnocylindria bacterium]|nr:hypothetical protein [Candidatus Limnocylindria bacterium]
MNHRLHAVLLLALCGVLYLPGMATSPLYTRGEAREALAVREVVHTGRWVVPMRPDGRLTRKPPLLYWTGMVAWRALPGMPEAAVRLPSVLAATLGVLAVACLGRTAFGLAAGGAALVLATSFEWMRSATSGRVDMLLSAAMTLVLLGWVARLSGRGRGWTSALVVVGTALAVLAKGPIGAAFPAAALVATALTTRDRTLLTLLVPLAGGAAAAALWYAIAYLEHGRAFLDIVLAENLGRFVDTTKAGTGHAHGPLFPVGMALVGLLPWTPLLPLAAAPVQVRPAVRTLLVAWIAVIVAVVTLSASKRSVYLLPAYPAVALLLAAGVAAEPGARLARLLRVTTAAYAPVVALVGAIVLAFALGFDAATLLSGVLAPTDQASLAAMQRVARQQWLAMVLVAAALVALAVLLARRRREGDWAGMLPPVAAVMAVAALTFQIVLRPAIAQARGFAGFMPVVARLVPPGEPLYAYFPVEPSVRFYAPRAVADWRTRPADRDVYFLAWEREVAALPAAARPALEQLAASEARYGRRGALVLLRVPRGVLPPRRAAAQKG